MPRKNKGNHVFITAKEAHSNQYCYDPFEELATQIVVVAVYDFKAIKKHLIRHPDDDKAQWQYRELVKFFNSDWCNTLTRLDMPRLLGIIEERVEKNTAKRKPKSGSTRQRACGKSSEQLPPASP